MRHIMWHTTGASGKQAHLGCDGIGIGIRSIVACVLVLSMVVCSDAYPLVVSFFICHVVTSLQCSEPRWSVNLSIACYEHRVPPVNTEHCDPNLEGLQSVTKRRENDVTRAQHSCRAKETEMFIFISLA